MLGICRGNADVELFPYPSVAADCAVRIVPRVLGISTNWISESFPFLPLIFLRHSPMRRFVQPLMMLQSSSPMRPAHAWPLLPSEFVVSSVPTTIVDPLDSEARILLFPRGFPSPSDGCAIIRDSKTVVINWTVFLNVNSRH